MPRHENQLPLMQIPVKQLELAMQVVNQANNRRSLFDPLVIPSELKHLQALEWQAVSDLLEALQTEKTWGQLH
jgi:hypothetical protein